MKNILIPTTFEEDTVAAMKIAAYIAENKGTITLLSNSPISDSITELLFLSDTDGIDVNRRSAVLNSWENYCQERGITMETQKHHQFGMSRPLLDKVLDRFDTDLVIAPLSFQKSKNYIHKMLLTLLHKSECPLMVLPEKGQFQESMQRALYLDLAGHPLSASLQHLPFHVIHQSMVHQTEGGSLNTLINQMKVDLIVKAKRNNESTIDNEAVFNLGLPVLTV